MDLWIRSQDKKVFRKANHLKIEKQGDKYCITEMATIYGKYDSEERAIEVLDLICNRLAVNCDHERNNTVGIMPEE